MKLGNFVVEVPDFYTGVDDHPGPVVHKLALIPSRGTSFDLVAITGHGHPQTIESLLSSGAEIYPGDSTRDTLTLAGLPFTHVTVRNSPRFPAPGATLELFAGLFGNDLLHATLIQWLDADRPELFRSMCLRQLEAALNRRLGELMTLE